MSRVPILALFASLPLSAVSLKQAVIGSQHDLTVSRQRSGEVGGNQHLRVLPRAA